MREIIEWMTAIVIVALFVATTGTIIFIARMWHDMVSRMREFDVTINLVKKDIRVLAEHVPAIRADVEHALATIRKIYIEGLPVKPTEETEAIIEELREIIDSAIHQAENTVSDLKHALLMVEKEDSDA